MSEQPTGVNEIVYIEQEDYKLSQKQMMAKYNICRTTTVTARKKGYFIKNWCKRTVLIDRENFDANKCYRIAKNVFYRIYYNSIAKFIQEDMIQEAVARMFELSGKIHQHSHDKIPYYYWVTAKNAMEVFYKQWYRSMPYKEMIAYECELLT